MNTLTLLHHGRYASVKPRTTARRALEDMQVLGLVIGLCGGVMVAVWGSLLTAAAWFVADEGARHVLSTMGAVLLFLTIPLFVLGACCLDWLEKDKTQDSSQVARYDDEDDDDDLNM